MFFSAEESNSIGDGCGGKVVRGYEYRVLLHLDGFFSGFAEKDGWEFGGV